jgi:C1A family cysteine protease
LSTIVYKKVATPVEYSPEVIAKFNAWLSEEKKLYGTPSEMKLRLQNFKTTLDKIAEINSQNLGWTAGLNQFSDLSPQEFEAKYLMKNLPEKLMAARSHGQVIRTDLEEVEQGPAEFDLRKEAGSNCPPIKNQGGCGSCYAFAATTSIEFLLALKPKSGHSYQGPVSPQELVDCSGGANQGCEGGFPSSCFEYAQEYGLMSEKDYPYYGEQGYCEAESIVDNSKIARFARVPQDSHNGLKNAIKNKNAVSIGVEAGKLQYYKEGVFGKNKNDCGNQPNHAVVAVGYGGNDNDGYWIIQNSWSKRWGLNGVYKLYRDGKDGLGACGAQSDGTYPLL